MGSQSVGIATAFSYCVLLALVGVLPSSASGIGINQFNETGGHATANYSKPVVFTLPSYTRVQVEAVITYPTTSQSDDGPPFPLVIAFNGFKCQASWYVDTVQRLASWGYVVFQYTVNGGADFPVGPGEREEVKYLQPLLDWLAVEVANISTPIAGRVDFNRKAVLGHSRGGKLAGLHYANRTDITTAVLLDPVDCGVNGFDHPSAVAALGGSAQYVDCGKRLPPLSRSNKRAAVIGAGFVNPVLPCNPPGTNYLSFLDVLAPGSWQVLMKKAGHMQFADSKGLAYKGIDTTCGPWLWARISTQDIIERARTIAVAWLHNVFYPTEYVDQQRLFQLWISYQEEAHTLTFNTTALIKASRNAPAHDVLETASGAGGCEPGDDVCRAVE